SGATSQTYVPVAGDVGHMLKVAETASNAGGSGGPVTSNATAAVVPPAPANVKPPTITGTAQQDQTLTAHPGDWTSSPTSVAYQWLRCDNTGANCVPISGATSPTYAPVAGDIGHAIRVQESATNGGGTSSPATSAATSAVLAPSPPTNTAQPTIS